jgi:ABC-type phosphate/phosphonate transport system ATPase subunit
VSVLTAAANLYLRFAMRRVVVIGSSGSGKSTVARRIVLRSDTDRGTFPRPPIRSVLIEPAHCSVSINIRTLSVVSGA